MIFLHNPRSIFSVTNSIQRGITDHQNYMHNGTMYMNGLRVKRQANTKLACGKMNILTFLLTTVEILNKHNLYTLSLLPLDDLVLTLSSLCITTVLHVQGVYTAMAQDCTIC